MSDLESQVACTNLIAHPSMDMALSLLALALAIPALVAAASVESTAPVKPNVVFVASWTTIYL